MYRTIPVYWYTRSGFPEARSLAARTRATINPGGGSAPVWQIQAENGRTIQPLGEYAYETIRAGILLQRWHPGDPLSEQQLAEELRISRTPVRQALQQLEREGFVLVLPSRGTFVAELSLDDVRDVYELRETIEAQVARWAAERGVDENIVSLESIVADAFYTLDRFGGGPRDIVATGRLDRLHGLGTRFHTALAELAGNRRANEALRQLDNLILRARLLHGTLRSPNEIWTDHARIVEAIRNRDSAGAEAAMRQHLRTAYECVQRATEGHS